MTILAAYNQSGEGRAALELAIEEAEKRGVPLVVAQHVKVTTDRTAAVPTGTTGGDAPRAVHGSRAKVTETQGRLERLEAELRSRGLDASTNTLASTRDPAEELLRFAKEIHAELIVIGMRRRSAVGKLVLGSTSQSILLGADCPVLAVKAD